ncbi:hypothetical protein ACFFX0_19580 [Citricoccus parietis]|uniref:Uncharacterized protein n=1 Tax=Citricoccus parietis TaxID=592307 RepID=A0ABV5G2W6_9MICC
MPKETSSPPAARRRLTARPTAGPVSGLIDHAVRPGNRSTVVRRGRRGTLSRLVWSA